MICQLMESKIVSYSICTIKQTRIMEICLHCSKFIFISKLEQPSYLKREWIQVTIFNPPVHGKHNDTGFKLVALFTYEMSSWNIFCVVTVKMNCFSRLAVYYYNSISSHHIWFFFTVGNKEVIKWSLRKYKLASSFHWVDHIVFYHWIY